MNQNDPYAKLGGGALDQELFKSNQTPPSAHVRNGSTIIPRFTCTEAWPSSSILGGPSQR